MDNLETETNSARLQPRSGSVRSLALGIVILLCGGVIGAVGTALYVKQFPFPGSRPQDRLPDKIADDMQHKYNLSAEQKDKVLAIFQEHVKNLHAIRTEVQPRVDAEHEALKRGVQSVLTPEQAKDWETEYEQRRHLWHPHTGDTPPAP